MMEQSDDFKDINESAVRLPEGYDLKTLCQIKGRWPKREITEDELWATYKGIHSAGGRRETFTLLKTFQTKYGSEVFDVTEEAAYRSGKESGIADQNRYKTLLYKLADIWVRPHSYETEVDEVTPNRIVYRAVTCPFADLMKKMKTEELGSHYCPPWHVAFAKEFGYRFEMPEFLLTGGSCCRQIWERETED